MPPKIVIYAFLVIILNILRVGTDLVDLEMPVVSVSLQNLGFHRDLHYEITLPEDWINHKCSFILHQKLPQGVYVNVDQLDDLTRRKKLNAVYPSHVDVELVATDASPFDVFLNFTSKPFQETTLPIHFRYHPPGTEKYVAVTLEPPNMYAACEYLNIECKCGPKLCQLGKNLSFEQDLQHTPAMCNWSKIGVSTHLYTSLTVEIPIGDITRYQVVAFITIIIGWFVFAHIIFVSEKAFIVTQVKLNEYTSIEYN